MEEEVKQGLSAGKISLIILTIVVLGPLIFLGSCFPIAGMGFGMGSNAHSILLQIFSSILFFGGLIGGPILSIWTVVEIIKKIRHPERKISLALKITLGAVILLIAFLFLLEALN
jgi:hypothetical protein